MPLDARREEADASRIVGLLLKGERAAVLHELSEFDGVAATQFRQGRFNLLLLDVVVLLVLAATGQALPWERAFDEVEKHVTNGLQIVSSGLLNALVSGNRSVPSSSSQIFAILVRDVLSFAILVAFGQTEVDDVDVVARRLRASNQEIIGLDVSVNYALVVDLLDSTNHLLANHQDCFEVKVSLASLEKVLDRWSEQIHHHHMEVLVWRRAIRADVIKARYTSYSTQAMSQRQKSDVTIVNEVEQAQVKVFLIAING